jgi:hypothetical protein
VNSIAYYKSKLGRHLFDEGHSHDRVQCVRINVHAEPVGLFGNEGRKLPLKIRNVVIGPSDLKPRPFKHCISNSQNRC